MKEFYQDDLFNHEDKDDRLINQLIDITDRIKMKDTNDEFRYTKVITVTINIIKKIILINKESVMIEID